MDHQSTRINIDTAIEAVTACLQVLDITNKVYELIRIGQRFAALKSLDDLQNIHLKEVQDFGFAQLINKNTPALTKVVRSDSLAELDEWIENLNTLSSKVGYAAFEYIDSLRDAWRKKQMKKPGLEKYKFNSPVELSYREADFNYLENSKVSEDLSALYECSLVHASLGLSMDFHQHFETQLKIKKDKLIPSTLKINLSEDAKDNLNESLKEIEDVLAAAAGFEILDKTISRRIAGLRPDDSVDECWLENSQSLIAKLRDSIKDLNNLEILQELRAKIILFIHVMEVFNFDVIGMQSLMIRLFKQYMGLSKEVFVKAFTTHLDNDDYMPMTASSNTEFEEICRTVWVKPDNIDGSSKQAYPKMLYFSQIYVHFCTSIREYIKSLEDFMSDLDIDDGLVEDLIKDIVDSILIENICKAFEERLSSTTREQIVQILLNLEYFEYASGQIEKLLQSHRTSGRTISVSLRGTEAFRAARKLAEARIFELVNSVVDDFLDIADYDWLTTTKSTQPSTYLSEMISFLKTMVNSTLINLPHSVKSFLYLDAFDHLASSLLKFLVDASNDLTPTAVANFDMDVRFLEDFVNEIAEDSNEMSLTTTFTELRQSIDLLRAEDMNEYNNTMVRMKKYDRVKPENAQALFQKAANAVRHQHQSSVGSIPGHSPQNSISSKPGRFKRYYKTVEKLTNRE